MRVPVTVDDREPASLLAAVRDHPDVAAVSTERLQAGDLAMDSVGIERKTPRDYVTSVMGRSGSYLYDQADRLRETFDHPYVLLEGDFRDLETLRTGVDPAAIRGSMASITARLSVPVIPCTDRTQLVDYAIRLARKHTETPSTRPMSVGAVASRREPTAKRMYGCIDGIGPELADTLYEHYPAVATLADATQAELLAIDGIGETRARTIQAALRDSRIETE